MLVAIVLGSVGFIFVLFVWSVCVVGGKADDMMERAAREREREKGGGKMKYTTKSTVVNIRDYQDWRRRGFVYIGRGSVFGNPYRMSKTCNRGEEIKLYEAYFYKKLAANPKFKSAVQSLAGKTLVCYCAPEACHGDIIASYLNDVSA